MNPCFFTTRLSSTLFACANEWRIRVSSVYKFHLIPCTAIVMLMKIITLQHWKTKRSTNIRCKLKLDISGKWKCNRKQIVRCDLFDTTCFKRFTCTPLMESCYHKVLIDASDIERITRGNAERNICQNLLIIHSHSELWNEQRNNLFNAENIVCYFVPNVIVL